MGKLSQLKQFEETKARELKEYEDSLQQAFQTFERDYQQRVKSILEELAPYRQGLRDRYLKDLQTQSNQVTQVVDAQMEKLRSYEKDVIAYAREVAKIIVG